MEQAFETIQELASMMSRDQTHSQKHIQLFLHYLNRAKTVDAKSHVVKSLQEFMIANRMAIASRQLDAMTVRKIVCSDRVFLPVATVLQYASFEVQLRIWNALAKLSMLLDPKSTIDSTLVEHTPSSSSKEQIRAILTKAIEQCNALLPSQRDSTSPLDTRQTVQSILDGRVLFAAAQILDESLRELQELGIEYETIGTEVGITLMNYVLGNMPGGGIPGMQGLSAEALMQPEMMQYLMAMLQQQMSH